MARADQYALFYFAGVTQAPDKAGARKRLADVLAAVEPVLREHFDLSLTSPVIDVREVSLDVTGPTVTVTGGPYDGAIVGTGLEEPVFAVAAKWHLRKMTDDLGAARAALRDVGGRGIVDTQLQLQLAESAAELTGDFGVPKTPAVPSGTGLWIGLGLVALPVVASFFRKSATRGLKEQPWEHDETAKTFARSANQKLLEASEWAKDDFCRQADGKIDEAKQDLLVAIVQSEQGTGDAHVINEVRKTETNIENAESRLMKQCGVARYPKSKKQGLDRVR